MTKHLRFLFVMLLAMIWSAGWAQTTVDFSNGLPTGWSQNNFVIKQTYTKKSCIQLKDNGKVTSPAFEEAYSSMKISLARSSNGKKFTVSYQIGSAAEVVIKTFTASEVVKSSWKDYTLNIPAAAQVANCKFIFSTDVASYYISSIEFTPAGPTKTATNVSFGDNSGKKFTFSKGVYTEGEFTTPIAKEKNNIAGTVVYSSNNEAAISVNASTGELSFLGYGEATITATFTPTNAEKYKESSDSYMVVNNNPNVKNVTFIDTIDKGNNASQNNSDEITKDGVTIFGTNAAFGNSNGNYRFYKGTKINISVTTGTITKIEFKNGSALNKLKGEGYTATDKAGTWIGNARTVVLTNSSSVAKARSITVYVSLPSEITLNESAPNTIEAKTGVNVTLKRPMNVGRWNTFCVPFSIDANQVTSQFGEGTQIAEYSVSVDNEIDFATVQSNAIVAGKAYLVKPTKVAATEGYTFSNVNITALKPTKETVDNGVIDFRGIYNPTDITVGLPTNTFAAGIVSNVVKKAVSDSNMKGFRAFFIIPEGAGAQSSYMLKIDGTATSINSINGADVVVNAPVYNLQGQRVDGNNLTPGIYVKSGKKFVVK